MATGALPFRGESSGVVFDGIMNRAPLPPLRLNPKLPPKLEDIINRALEKDRELRFQSAAEMRSELKRLKRDVSSGRISLTDYLSVKNLNVAASNEGMPVQRAAARTQTSRSSTVLAPEARKQDRK